MNAVHAKNNRYKNGEYNPSYSFRWAKEQAKSIEPSIKMLQYRDELYKFCVQNGLIRDSFKLGRTKQTIKSNIYALKTILRKNGLDGEFFGGADNG